jgi:hypothetical protein
VSGEDLLEPAEPQLKPLAVNLLQTELGYRHAR